MALRSMGLLRSIASHLTGSGTSAAATYSTSTTPKMKSAYAPTVDLIHQEKHSKKPLKGDFVPVYVAMGMIVLSMSLGLYTAKQQVLYCPSVRVRKKLRETLPEVEYPERVVNEADKLVKTSFFRKVAHVQKFDTGLQYLPDSVRKDVFAHTPGVITLKDAGVDPKQH